MINLSTLKNFSYIKKYPRNTVIAGDNAPAELVVIVKGVVGIYAGYAKQSKEMVATIGPGDFIGETILLEKDASTTAVALTDVIALSIGKANALSFIKDEPELSLELIKAMSAKLDSLGTAYEKLSGRPWAEVNAPSREASDAQAAKAQEPSPAAPAAPPPAAPEQAPPLQCAGFSLFPEGHGSYQLELKTENRTYMMERGYTCPICKKEFKTLSVRASRLVEENTDSDMRHHYKGIEPLYYDVVTCPNCLYSALTDMFAHPDILKADMPELHALKSQAEGMFGMNVSTWSVFAGYFLALLCAPKYFTAHHLAAAKLLLKLSRIYQDCGDRQMEDSTAKRALDAYMYLYINEQNDASQDQQLCIVIGELNLKLNDLKNAREFLFKAKVTRGGSPLLKNHAENRLLAIRTPEKQ